MKTPRALRSFSVLALAALLAAAGSPRQDSDDFTFAKRLAYRGWFDLAADVCARIERDTSLPRDVRSALPILHAEIDLARADRETDPDKALKHLGDSIAALQKFIADEPTHPRMFEAQINIGFVKLRKAKALIDQMEVAKDAGQVDRRRKEAATLYTEVATEFEACVQNWRRLPTTDEIAGAIMDARLEANRARYEHSRIPGLGEADRKSLLEETCKSLIDFEIDYGDTAKAFEAMLLEGRCLFDLGDNAQAETKLKNTIALKDVLSKAKIPRNSYFDQIIFGAYLTMAQLYLKAGRAKDADKFIDGVFAGDPGVEREWIGQTLKVEKVEALYRLKNFSGAEALANKVIAADPDGPFASRMRERLRTLGTRGGGGVRMSPEQLISAAEGSIERNRLREAQVTLRQTIENCVTPEAREKFVPRALYLMGQCLQLMQRNYEAAINFEKVFTQYPKHELAPKACWEAVVCFSSEFDTFELPADEKEKDRLMDTLLKLFPGAKEGDNIPYLQGLKLENARKLKEAAEKYFQVPTRAPAYERALVRGAYCLRADAFRQYAQWSKTPQKDPAVQKAIRDQFDRAEKLFKDFLKRVNDIPVTDVDVIRDRAALVLVANQELAYIYSHDVVKKAPEGLEFLEKAAKGIPPDDERMATIHKLQINLHLALNQVDEAVKILELMFVRFQRTRETAQACRSVAIKLDEITSAHLKAREQKGETELDDLAKENLKKISKYYNEWLRGAMAFGMGATDSDVMIVGETLYMTAKRLNGIPDTIGSFMDQKKIVAYKNYFEDAEFVHSLLVGERFKGKHAPKDLLVLMARRARCFSFVADQSETWGRAKAAYEDIIKEFQVVDAKGQFNQNALLKFNLLPIVYIELGAVYKELGKWNKIHYDNAITVFTNIAGLSDTNSEPWWISRFMIYDSYFLRGSGNDITKAEIGIKQLEANYPNFDEGKYGLKDRFIDLKKRIGMAVGSGR